MKKTIIILMIILSTITLSAVTTSYFEQDSIRDFEQGELKGISINQKGELFLSPSSKALFSQGDNFVWDVCQLKDDSLIALTGIDGNVYRIDKAGKYSLIRSLGKVSARRIINGGNGLLYIAVSPNPRILSFNPKNNKFQEVVKFSENYLWDMAIAPNGKIYAALGDPAVIYEIDTKLNSKKVIYKNKKEGHFLSIAINKAGSLYFGSEGNGILFKKLQSGKVKPIYNSYEGEISAIHITDKGIVYFSTASQSRKYNSLNFNYQPSIEFREKDTRTQTSAKKKKKHKTSMMNSVYKIKLNDKIEKIFTMKKTSFYSITSDRDENIFIGSGDKGVIYKVTKNGISSRLLKFRENQILRLQFFKNNLYVATGNDGSLFKLDFSSPSKGEFLSRIFDCTTPVTWGTITTQGDIPKSGSVKIMTRTGNTDSPDKHWSQWDNCNNNGNEYRIVSPKNRYIQYKIKMSTKDITETPKISAIKIPFLHKNRAPRILSLRLISKNRKTTKSKKSKKRSSILSANAIISWVAKDDDHDKLSYDLYFKIGKDPYWRLLNDKMKISKLPIKTSYMPDGYYYFRVIASDFPSNNKRTALKSRFDSKRFLIDNTPPKFSDLKAYQSGDKIIITGKVKDNFSPIIRIKYSINTREWYYSGPADSVFDNKTELFKIVIDRKNNPNLFSGTNILILRTADEQENKFTTKMFFNVKLKEGDASKHNNEHWFIKHEK